MPPPRSAPPSSRCTPKNDGAWIKNVAEEARMVDAMRKGADLTVKGTSGRLTQSTDQYSLKGLAQALDKIEQECK
jgi:invasion protein IalB